jgi:hypothetical protein
VVGELNNCNRRRRGSVAGGIMRFLAGALLIVLPFAAGAAESVGTVTRVQNQAQIGTTTAVVGTPVHMNERLRTGANARLQVTFSDNSVLTLGEKANVVVDRYVYNPSKSRGELVLNGGQGALRFVGGKIENMKTKKVIITTPNAAMAVRGTDFWAGPIDGQYGVLLLKGRVRVTNQGRAVTLYRSGWGVDIPLARKRSRK